MEQPDPERPLSGVGTRPAGGDRLSATKADKNFLHAQRRHAAPVWTSETLRRKLERIDIFERQGPIMSWDAIGAIAELSGAIAVIASLVYLSIQIRAGTSQSRAQLFHQVTSEQARVSDAVTTGDNYPVWLKMYRGEPLADDELGRALFITSRFVSAYHAIDIGHENGLIGDSFYRDAKEQVNYMIGGKNASLTLSYLRRAHPNTMHSAIFSDVIAAGESMRAQGGQSAIE